MAFTVTPKEGPAKVEGALNGSSERPKTARDRAIEALMGQGQPTPEAPKSAPVVDPAAAAAANSHPGDGQISPESFSNLQQKARAEQEKPSQNQSPANEAAPATPPVKSASEATKTDEGSTEQPLNPRFAQLARQEKALRAREAQFKQQQAEFDRRVAEAVKAKEAELQGKYVPKDRLTKETLQVLEEAGVDYNTLTQQALGEPQDPRDVRIASLETKLSEALEKIEGLGKTYQDDKTQSYQQAKDQIQYNVSKLVSKDPNYEMITATDSVSDVVDLIEKTFHEGLDDDHPKGTLLTVEEAAQIVEDYLVAEGERLARLQKIQKRLAPPTESKKQDQTPSKQDSGVQPQRQPSLTNAMTGAPKKEYSARQRAMFAAQYGPNWQEKVGDKAS